MITNKKKYLFLALVLLLSSLIVLIPKFDYSFIRYIEPNSTVSFYTLSPLKKVPSYITQTNVGAGAILECSSKNAKKVAKLTQDITGISFCFEGTTNDIDSFLDKVDAVILKCETIDENISTYLAHSPKLENEITLDNQKVNLQIAIVDSTITIGSPIILGEY